MQSLKQQVNRKVVCIVFASAYGYESYPTLTILALLRLFSMEQRDPMALAQKTKEEGHYVLTVSAMPKNGNPADAHRIGNMASDGMNFTIIRDSPRVSDEVIKNMRRSLCEGKPSLLRMAASSF